MLILISCYTEFTLFTHLPSRLPAIISCFDNWFSYCGCGLPYLPIHFNHISLLHLYIVQSNMFTLFTHLPPSMLILISCYTEFTLSTHLLSRLPAIYLCICLLSLPYLPFYSQHLSNNHCRAWSSLSSLIPSLILHTSQVAKRQLWQIRVLCPFLGHKTLFYAQFLDIGHESVMLSSCHSLFAWVGSVLQWLHL